MARLPRVNALLLGVLRASSPPAGLTMGSRIPDTMRLPFLMARRSGGAFIHPEQADAPLVDVQVWAIGEKSAEEISQWARDALYRASRTPRIRVPGVGYINFFDEQVGPREIPADTDDHGTVRYQASYSITTRPDWG